MGVKGPPPNPISRSGQKLKGDRAEKRISIKLYSRSFGALCGYWNLDVWRIPTSIFRPFYNVDVKMLLVAAEKLPYMIYLSFTFSIKIQYETVLRKKSVFGRQLLCAVGEASCLFSVFLVHVDDGSNFWEYRFKWKCCRCKRFYDCEEMKSMHVFVKWCKQFEDAFENAQWRKDK